LWYSFGNLSGSAKKPFTKTIKLTIMKRLRLWIIVLVIWLILIFNVERINSPVNIRSHTYIFIAAAAMITLITPRLQSLPLLLLLLAPVPAFLWFKAFMENGPWYENLMRGYALPVTLTQISTIILTGLLARQINHGLIEFEEVIAQITFGRIGQPPRPFSEEQGLMYSEVKRARRYQRPLGVIALKADDKTIQGALPKIVQEVQQAMLKEFVMAGIARTLDEHTFDFDTIALHNHHFIVVLPEAGAEQVPSIAQRLEKAVKEKLNIKLGIGMANLPDDAITFEKLVEVALTRVNSPTETQPVSKQSPQQIFSQEM
jgi:hypothetical protein